MKKSIIVKSKLLKRFITEKDSETKESSHRQCQDNRNMLSTLYRKSKPNYFNQYFKANMNNINSTWKIIKSIKILKIYHLIFQRIYLSKVSLLQTK